jgi:hypothetical protein
LFQAGHLILRLAQMTLKTLLELWIARLFDHLGQCLQDLLFGIVDVTQGMHEKVVHILDVLREEAHDVSPWSWCKGALGVLCLHCVSSG